MDFSQREVFPHLEVTSFVLPSIFTNDMFDVEGVFPLHAEGIAHVFNDRIKTEKEFVRQETQTKGKEMMWSRDVYIYTVRVKCNLHKGGR